jgi:hypothetical protein
MPTHNSMGGLQKRLGVFLAAHHVLERIVVQLDVDRNGEAFAALRLADTRVDGQLGAARQGLSSGKLLGIPGFKSTALRQAVAAADTRFSALRKQALYPRPNSSVGGQIGGRKATRDSTHVRD